MSFEWKTVKLGDIATFFNGRAYKNEEFKDKGTPIVRIQNLTGEGKTVYSDLVLDDYKYIDADDLIYAWSATFGAYIWKGVKSIYHYHIWKIIVNSTLTDKKFLYYKLGQISEELRENGNGTLFVHITKGFMESFEITLPPLSIQQKIAEILSSLDDKIELNRQTNATLEAIAQTLFKEWFVVTNTEGLLPDGWRMGKLGEICNNFRSSVNPKNISFDTKYIGLEHISRKSLPLENWGNAEDVDSQKSRFEKWDIIFGKLRPYFHKVTFAPFEGICSTDILVIKPKTDDWFAFSLMYLYSDEIISFVSSIADGTRMPRVDWKSIANYEIIIPNENKVKEFENIVRPFFEKMIENIQENQTLTRLRDSLLPKLLRGDIAV